MRIIPRLLIAILLLLGAHAASAQSLTSGCSNPPPGYNVVWTPGQWTACFESFQPSLGYTPVNRAGDRMSGKLNLLPSSSSAAGLNFGVGVAPTSPVDGDAWATSTGIYVRVNGVTIGPLVSGATSPVTSVFGRTGAVVAANGDYAIGQISGLGTGVATALVNALNGAGGVAPVGSPHFTGTVTNPDGGTFTTSADNLAAPTTVSGASFGLTGNFSGSSIFGTNGLRYKNAAATITDTSSSGTIATNYDNVWGGSTLAASTATTITNEYGSYFEAPVAGTNVTLTNKWALGADSFKAVGHIQFPGLATGTAAGSLCLDSSGNVLNSSGANCFGSTFNLTPITNSLAANVALTTAGQYYDGPSVAQGSTGTWFASGCVVMSNAAATAWKLKLWDGTTLIASSIENNFVTSTNVPDCLSGYLVSPAGNIRISVADSTGGGSIVYNGSGLGMDSTISAFRVQ